MLSIAWLWLTMWVVRNRHFKYSMVLWKLGNSALDLFTLGCCPGEMLGLIIPRICPVCFVWHRQSAYPLDMLYNIYIYRTKSGNQLTMNRNSNAWFRKILLWFNTRAKISVLFSSAVGFSILVVSAILFFYHFCLPGFQLWCLH